MACHVCLTAAIAIMLSARSSGAAYFSAIPCFSTKSRKASRFLRTEATTASFALLLFGFFSSAFLMASSATGSASNVSQFCLTTSVKNSSSTKSFSWACFRACQWCFVASRMKFLSLRSRSDANCTASPQLCREASKHSFRSFRSSVEANCSAVPHFLTASNTTAFVPRICSGAYSNADQSTFTDSSHPMPTSTEGISNCA
mmetsp:Transcript_31983/g.73008  ORF Transcript_31983/g.73008 Transcript_31983/m.73008 type:complete len:201 (+) Transcript_31983:859-1461(+)